MNDSNLTLTVAHTDGPLALVTATGQIDIDTAPALRARALELIAAGHPHLILDLGGVTFCDSSGFNALIGILRCANDADGSLALAAVPDRLSRMLDLTGVSRLMPSYAHAAEAFKAHGATAPAGPGGGCR
ncbi:STAS domain-containing protein [Streptomyces sp. A3M-1-3]|uniref:STAS domain-containing protein n=1 Tax=Streptomyces sp. A3M-1-3 TaxID=2962044 RepID=UPI0020B67C57|nr:STAS domain-containing protein [Streptomyces sp. A3M-1-3]MCP3822227.1 STAS domain-containing protein [Streptomyces sp. A3M-1-3]